MEIAKPENQDDLLRFLKEMMASRIPPSAASRGLAKGSKREKSNFSGGLEVLTHGEILAIIKPHTELANLTRSLAAGLDSFREVLAGLSGG